MTEMIQPLGDLKDSVTILQDDFRYHLERFYTLLHLAPPYHTIEQAIRHLSREVTEKSECEQQALIRDHSLKWQFYAQVFLHTGLPLKHRGIIQGLLKRSALPTLPEEYRQHFLQSLCSESGE